MRFFLFLFLIFLSKHIQAQDFNIQEEIDSTGSVSCSRSAELAKKSVWSAPISRKVGDFIFVDKGRRLLHVMAEGQIIKTYRVALGKNPVGPKRKEGDNKTPEGVYTIGYKNSASDYHLSLAISYPNQDDIDWARKNGVSPGGDIMIHGLPNNRIKRALIRHPSDWTRGCVAVTNAEIEEIWSLIASQTTVTLCP